MTDWASDYVKAVARGYYTREGYLRKYHYSRDNKICRIYIALNRAIDESIAEICLPGERADILESLITGRTYEYSPGFPGSRNYFYKVKSAVIERIAKKLNIK